MTSESECRFCVSSEAPVRENELAKVLLSNPRKVPGHILVLPKRHVEQPWDLTPEELQAVYELVFFVEQRVVGKLGDGVDVRQNYRPYIAENKLKVNHVHFHVIPRSDQDYIYTVSEKFEKDLFADLDKLERTEVEKLLK